VRVVVLAYHDVGCACLDLLLRAGDEVLAVYTHRDAATETIWFDSVTRLAESHHIPVHRPRNINRPRWIEAIREATPDIILSFNYRQLVCREILDIHRLGAINLHCSYLPAYRGRCPVNWALIHGELETGVSLHYMVEAPDAGDLVAQRRIPIALDDTARTLHREVVREAAVLLEETLPAIRSGTNARVAQDLAAGSQFGKRRPEDGRIEWSLPAVQIYNLVRAVTHPFPGAFGLIDDKPFFIWDARPENGDAGGHTVPGRVVARDGLSIETGRGRLRVLRCQLAGHPEMDGDEFVERYGCSNLRQLS